MVFDQQPDCERKYYIGFLRFYFILEDVKNAVSLGDSDRLASLRKLLLKHFESDSAYKTYAIKMFISIIQDAIFLAEAQTHQTRWTFLQTLHDKRTRTEYGYWSSLRSYE